MKILLLLLAVVLLPTKIIDLEKSENKLQLIAKFQVCKAIDNGQDVSLQTVMEDVHIVFYMDGHYFCMGILALASSSQLHGLITHTQALKKEGGEIQDYPDEVQFLWHYAPADEAEPARCRLITDSSEHGPTYHLYIQQEDKLIEYHGR